MIMQNAGEIALEEEDIVERRWWWCELARVAWWENVGIVYWNWRNLSGILLGNYQLPHRLTKHTRDIVDGGPFNAIGFRI